MCCWMSLTIWARSPGRGRSLTARTCGPKGGRADRALAGRPLAQRQQAPPDLLRQRAAARGHADGGEPQRHHPAARARRPCPADRRAQPLPPQDAAGRPRLRQPRSQRSAQGAWHHATDRQARQPRASHRTRLRLGNRALGDRTHHLLAAQPAPPRPPLRPARRHPRSIPHDRLRPHLPQATHPTPTLILLGPLRVPRWASRGQG